MVMYLVIVNLLAAVGLVAILYIIDEVKKDRKIKKEQLRKKQLKKELLAILEELEEKEKNEL